MEPNIQSYDGGVEIAGCLLECYTLKDGQKIIDLDGVKKLIDKIDSGYQMSEDEFLTLVAVKRDRVTMQRLPATTQSDKVEV